MILDIAGYLNARQLLGPNFNRFAIEINDFAYGGHLRSAFKVNMFGQHPDREEKDQHVLKPTPTPGRSRSRLKIIDSDSGQNYRLRSTPTPTPTPQHWLKPNVHKSF